MIRTSCLIVISAVSLVCVCPQAACRTGSDPFGLDTSSFKLSESNAHPYLVLANGKKIRIPRQWLYPPEEVERERDFYVTSFNYLEPVSSFWVGRQRVGLHLSSWDCMPPGTGSAMAAAGRDIFMVYHTRTQQIRPGLLDLGITKERARAMGCFFATFHDFFIGDVNGDGLTDIAMTLEEIWCEQELDEERQIDVMSGPYYKKHPIEWYVMEDTKWQRAPRYDGIGSKKAAVRLPAIGLQKSPVEFVRKVYKGKVTERK